jgi:DNA-binding GntR family transcriptional regulator
MTRLRKPAVTASIHRLPPAHAPRGKPDTPEAASLADQAATALRNRIVDLTLLPGTQLDERVLMQRVGISRTPAREALNRLVAEGLVQVRANRGIFVRPLDLDDTAQFFGAYYVAERSTAHFCRFDHPRFADDMAALQRAHAEAVAAGKFLAVATLNAEFHQRIAEATGNAYLIDFAARIDTAARRLVYVNEAAERHHPAEQQRHIVREHGAIVDRIRAGDRDGLIAALTVRAGRFQARIARFIGGGRGASFPVARP